MNTTESNITENIIKVQIYSDLHIDLWNKIPNLPVHAKYLFLAGDICKLSHPLFYKFFDYCSSNWEKVFYTPGNHEFYNRKKTYNELDFHYNLKLVERYTNVHYLNNSSTSLNEDIDVYGSTFWTKPPFRSIDEAKYYINDYNNIRYFDPEKRYPKDITIHYMDYLSSESYKGIQEFLNERTKKCIIMTHFPPLSYQTSNPKYNISTISRSNMTNDLISSYFRWPDDTIQKLLCSENKSVCPLAWISGHTHWSYDLHRSGVRFISNQLGYRDEIGLTGLNEDGVYNISICDDSSYVS